MREEQRSEYYNYIYQLFSQTTLLCEVKKISKPVIRVTWYCISIFPRKVFQEPISCALGSLQLRFKCHYIHSGHYCKGFWRFWPFVTFFLALHFWYFQTISYCFLKLQLIISDDIYIWREKKQAIYHPSHFPLVTIIILLHIYNGNQTLFNDNCD